MQSVRQSAQISLNGNLSKTENGPFKKDNAPKKGLEQQVFEELSPNLAGIKASLSPIKVGSAKNEGKGGKKISERK